ncbi:hypothetical protein E3Q06_04398 [Wallemia mellicola]|nr:hypothetical protein E3Q21_04404 [Wallemia mellicola]TIB82865.1 hypothetical protein E3Q20_04397 [Wallemia mellicola]TIC36663.1 hypothetical protein E3Q07_04403 [Wallemia mellicola]TIC43223.1 hypothetical protein E3Q06_04398 [Wallemia mellicola]
MKYATSWVAHIVLSITCLSFLPSLFAKELRRGKENCRGSDLCLVDPSSFDNFSTEENGGDDSLYISIGGNFIPELSGGDPVNDESSFNGKRSMQKRLGLASCCFGQFANVAKRSENQAGGARDLPYNYRYGQGVPSRAWYDGIPNYASTALGINAGYNTLRQFIVDMITVANRDNRCNNDPFYDATQRTGLKMCIIDEGSCATTAEYETIYDGVDATLSYLKEQGCTRCCATLSHGGKWKATIKATTGKREDGSMDFIDPCILDCSSGVKHSCKTNEHYDNACRVVKDEL